ncbi:hypothetical protein BN903_31 [Halorubrum sp. AJ67]|nr:hypothetical protein BN903_31 [Halorubrum sp. AJ67]
MKPSIAAGFDKTDSAGLLRPSQQTRDSRVAVESIKTPHRGVGPGGQNTPVNST